MGTQGKGEFWGSDQNCIGCHALSVGYDVTYAFDSVIETAKGVRGLGSKKFYSNMPYCSGVNSECSSMKEVLFGVAQGSLLGNNDLESYSAPNEEC